MRGKRVKAGLETGLRFAVAFPAAYLGGSFIFGILVEATWLFYALALILKPTILDVLVIGLVWIVRAGILLFLMVEWVFPGKAQEA